MAVVVGPVANFAPNVKPIEVEGLGSYVSGGKMTLTVQQARRLRDSLNIVLQELEGTIFDRDDA